MTPTPDSAPQGPTILVVDDEPDILLSLGAVIEASLPGATVVPVDNARHALKVLKEMRVDMIVSDFKMPGMNGLELLTALREDYPHVPRILITAFPATGLTMRAVNEAGVLGIFAKPFDGRKLVASIAEALRPTV